MSKKISSKNESEQIKIFDSKTNDTIEICKIIIDFDFYPWKYENYEYLYDKQIILLSNYLHVFKCDFTGEMRDYIEIYNPTFDFVTWNELTSSEISIGYFHDILVFNNDTSFNKILEHCKLYFNYILKKQDFEKYDFKEHDLEIITNFLSDFDIDDDINLTKPITFDVNNLKIRNKIESDDVPLVEKNILM